MGLVSLAVLSSAHVHYHRTVASRAFRSPPVAASRSRSVSMLFGSASVRAYSATRCWSLSAQPLFRRLHRRRPPISFLSSSLSSFLSSLHNVPTTEPESQPPPPLLMVLARRLLSSLLKQFRRRRAATLL
ncbi:hypothetical protein IG631_24043 [Alternaria alternata]|nr:hypothetical protein IG631_24043 [Alternaria alternata]